jgi:hypothetical protein
MRLCEPSRLVGLVVTLLSSAAFSQGFELDLSEPEIPAEFRPSIAVIGVTSGEATEDAVITARAKMLEAELIKATTGNAAFGRVMTPTQAAEELGPTAAAARKCVDYACLDSVARKLKVDRLILGLVTKSGPASLLTVYGFDGVLPEVVDGLVESAERAEKAKIGGFAGIQGKSQAQKDKEFARSAVPVFFEVLEKVKTSNGKIAVDSAETSSVAMMNNVELGLGSFEKIVPRGSYDIKVTAAGYIPYETKVVVEPQKVAQVKVLLAAKEIVAQPVVVAEVQRGTPVFERPGLYIAVAGLVAAGVGVGLGMSAKSVEARAKPDGNGVVPISRTAAKGAQTNAMIANVLVGVGAAATVGGAVWFILTPSAGKKKEEAPPVDTGGGFGVMVGYGGSF